MDIPTFLLVYSESGPRFVYIHKHNEVTFDYTLKSSYMND